MSRLALVQLVLFALIAAVVIPFGIVYVVGPQGFGGGQIRLHANMSDAFGLTKGTVVTYRGVQVGGKVSEVELDAGTRTARVELSLNDNTEIPTDSVAKVTMGTAAGIQNVDIYPPNTDHGPYLRDGDEIAMPADQQPVQMSQLMLQASGVLEGIDPQAISDIGTELGNSFNGLGPSLATMIDNGGTMSAQLNDQSAELAALLSRTSTLVDSMATQSDSFVRGNGSCQELHRTTRIQRAGADLPHRSFARRPEQRSTVVRQVPQHFRSGPGQSRHCRTDHLRPHRGPGNRTCHDS